MRRWADRLLGGLEVTVDVLAFVILVGALLFGAIIALAVARALHGGEGW